MAQTREELERLEEQTLAPYAQRSGETRGRRYPEPPPEWRTHYQRDRDRVIHSRAFRRLEYKTQVFLNDAGDHFRTRLTPTLEAAAIARNLARALRLNEDLAEAIALAHDLGHPPFGHTGEAALNRLMAGHGGFEHNRQSLRIVDELEQKYPGFPGLNLSWEVREGLAKHQTVHDRPELEDALGFEAPLPSLEAQVADVADEIAYYSHDLDDGLEAGLLDERRLEQEISVWRRAAEQVRARYGALSKDRRRFFIVRCLIDELVRDVVVHSEERICRAAPANADEARRQPEPLVLYSSQQAERNAQLRSYLYENLYYHPRVHGPNRKAARMLEALFEYYLRRPEEIGEGARARAGQVGLPRAVCDYLAGMTDRYAVFEYNRLIGGKE
ncbi:MAG: deoxyguanosinetriphosphate triphosphohydrolase [Verrucomicrobia bacterium]|nr:deoxyguanosinetriphosphate triphosphohydrolase [Verrucomicrobiota bacterium]